MELMNENAYEKPMKGYRYKYCILLCFPGYDINEPHHRQPQKYRSLQKLWKGCEFYNTVEIIISISRIQRKWRNWG
jgi:hypothetical protein